MPNNYFARYESPNIVIVPTSTTNTTTIAANSGPSTNKPFKAKCPDVFSKTLNKSLVNNDFNMSTNCREIDSVEEALRKLHNVQTAPAVLSSKHEETFTSNSKYSCQSNLIELTNTINNDITLKSVASFKKQEIGAKVSKRFNIEANKEHVQDFDNTAIIEQSVLKQRLKNNTNSSAYSNKNISSTTPFRTENKSKHMNIPDQNKDSQSIIDQTETKDSPCVSSRKRFRKQEDCNDKNVNKTTLEQQKALKMKASSSSNKNDKKHFEPSSKGKLTLPSKEQKNEYENIKSNNDRLRSARLSHEQITVKTSGALKRYLDYRRFLDKCCEKRDKRSSLRELKLREERTSKYLKVIKENEPPRNVNPSMERKEKKENLKMKSVIERAKRKQKSKKINSYIDKKISHEESPINEYTKYKKDYKDTMSTERMKTKDEIKIKLTSYIASKKKKEKPDEKHAKDAKTIDPNRKLSLKSKREKSRDRKDVSSKPKSQKKECNGNSHNNSERKKLKEETNKKPNKIKTSRLKKKKEFEHNRTQTSRKSELSAERAQISRKNEFSAERNSSSRKITEMTPTSTRTVAIITKTSGINLPSTNTIDLRSKLTRKRTINQRNTDITGIKSCSKRENLLVTLKQDVQARRSESPQAVSKPKVKKFKKIKLVINIKCPNSNDDSDEIANESELEIASGNTSPQQDLSFLDDIDIDGIVDSLNTGQRMKSPMRENNISTEVGLSDELICKNNSNSSVEALKRDCHLKAIQHPDLLICSEQSNVGSINEVTNPQVIATKNNTNFLKGIYNDDVYEVIDITLVDDDSVLVSMDQNQNVEQLIVSHTKGGNKSDILLNESNKTNPEVPVIYINDDSRDGTGGLNIADAEVNKRELLDVKHWDAQVNAINANQETSNNISKELKNPKKENEVINMKYECREVSEIVVASDLISNDSDHPNIKKESHEASLNPLLNIGNKPRDNNIVPSASIKKEASDEIIDISTCVKKEPHVETISSTKKIKSENVSVTLPIQSNIDSKYNDMTPANNVTIRNATIIKSENTNYASSEYDSNFKKDSINPTVEVNQSKYAPFIEKLNTELSKNKTKPAETLTSKTKNPQDNPVTDSSTKIQSIPKESKLKTSKDIDNTTVTPQTNLENKNLEADEAPSFNTEHINGNLNKRYINTMEMQMFESLHKKFTVLDFIHCGYFSNIYKCQDSSGRLYAVKVLRNRFLSMGMYKKSIFTGLQKIRNKYGYFNLEIISHFYMGWELCCLTEYYPRNLGEELANKKSLNIDVVKNLSRQLVSAVIMLTRNCIIHSDIKPSHILVNSECNRLKLCGFDRADYGYNIKITPSSGTTSYRAPEIILGYKADYKIDVWAAALVIYEMASGTKLFPGTYNNQILYHQICTLGPIHIEMLERGTQVHKHFLNTNFMQQVGPKEYVCITEFPVESHKLRIFNNTAWSPIRTQQLITEGPDKFLMLHRLLKRMLIIHPRHRIPITEVPFREFLL